MKFVGQLDRTQLAVVSSHVEREFRWRVTARCWIQTHSDNTICIGMSPTWRKLSEKNKNDRKYHVVEMLVG